MIIMIRVIKEPTKDSKLILKFKCQNKDCKCEIATNEYTVKTFKDDLRKLHSYAIEMRCPYCEEKMFRYEEGIILDNGRVLKKGELI